MRVYRILIVDDHRDIRRLLRASIETLGSHVQVVDVPSGEEAILVNSRQPFNLLVTDVRLPGISGLELIEHAQIRNPNLRIFLVTGLTDPSVRERVQIAKADAYFYKPIDIAAFLKAVTKVLNLETASERKGKGRGKPENGNKSASSAGISARLAGLRGQLDAHCAVLLSERGDILAQAGALPPELEGEDLIQATLAGLNSLERVSLMLGVIPPNGVSIVNGEKFDLAFRHVGQSIGLLLVASGGALSSKKAGDLTGGMKSAAGDILGILSDIGVPVEPVESEALARPEAEPEEAEAQTPSEDVEMIFRQAKKAKAIDADAFWDSAVETEGMDENLRSDTISYDQARQLGIAPEGD